MPSKREIEILKKNEEQMKTLLEGNQEELQENPNEEGLPNEMDDEQPNQETVIINAITKLVQRVDMLEEEKDALEARIFALEDGLEACVSSVGCEPKQKPLKFTGTSGSMKPARELKFPRKTGPGNFYPNKV